VRRSSSGRAALVVVQETSDQPVGALPLPSLLRLRLRLLLLRRRRRRGWRGLELGTQLRRASRRRWRQRRGARGGEGGARRRLKSGCWAQHPMTAHLHQRRLRAVRRLRLPARHNRTFVASPPRQMTMVSQRRSNPARIACISSVRTSAPPRPACPASVAGNARSHTRRRLARGSTGLMMRRRRPQEETSWWRRCARPRRRCCRTCPRCCVHAPHIRQRDDTIPMIATLSSPAESDHGTAKI
jgi:hypothetical protein